MKIAAFGPKIRTFEFLVPLSLYRTAHTWFIGIELGLPNVLTIGLELSEYFFHQVCLVRPSFRRRYYLERRPWNIETSVWNI